MKHTPVDEIYITPLKGGESMQGKPMQMDDLVHLVTGGADIQGVKAVTGFYEESGAMVRVVFADGNVIIGPMLPTMAALYRIGFFDPVKQKRPHLRLVGR